MAHDPTKAFKGDIRVIVSDGPFLDREPVVINCINPEHEDHTPSMKVYPDGAKCWGCGKLYSVYAFAAEYWGCTEDKAKERIKSGVLPPPVVHTRPERATPDVGKLAELAQVYHSNLGPSEYDYFFSRGLTGEAITKGRLGYTGTAYSIPLYGKGGELQTIRYRREASSDHLSGPKYWGTRGLNDTYLYVPPLFGWGDRWEGWEDNKTIRAVVLCEGELDALLLASHGIRAVSFTNGAGSVTPEMVVAELGECSKVYLCLDGDHPGRLAAMAAREALASSGVETVCANMQRYKDVTEIRQRNPAVFADWVSHLALEFAV